MLDKPLTNASIGIYPFRIGDGELQILSVRMDANSWEGSQHYSVKKVGAGYRVVIPSLNSGDAIDVTLRFTHPAGARIDIFADGYSHNKIAEPSCDASKGEEVTIPSNQSQTFYNSIDPMCKPTGGELYCNLGRFVSINSEKLEGWNVVKFERHVSIAGRDFAREQVLARPDFWIYDKGGVRRRIEFDTVYNLDQIESFPEQK